MKPSVLLDNLSFPESPRWHDNRLWFSDWNAQEVIALDLEGKSEVITHVQAFPFCIDFLPDGRPLVVAGKLLLGMEPGGSLVTYADLSSLADGFNEIVMDGRGNAYVNGGDFDFETGTGVETGVIALATPDGTVRRVADNINFGNGMAVTPDNKTLIVAESWARRLTAFHIAANGNLSNRRVWADLGDGAPDGICLDAENAVWYGDVPNKRCVRVREGGEILQTVDLDRGCFACTLGGADKQTLFMTANEWQGTTEIGGQARMGQVLTGEAPAPGVGWP